MAMLAELKHKWLAALRSGKYKQAREALYKPDVRAYCCLGVLCKVAGLKIHTQNDSVQGAGENPGEAYEPLTRVLGLPKKMCSSLAYKNDSGATFEEIARIISKNLHTV